MRLKERAPPRLSIVALPFSSIGGDPEQDYFVDGVTENLTTDLSRIAGAFVIGRSTAFTYKNKSPDLRQIGRELNVRYVLEGSVQRAGNRMRVNVQLIEAETGSHLWAERFDKAVADLFDMQDEIVARLASQLNGALIEAEARRAGRTSAQSHSMDLYFQGRALYNRGFAPDILAKAREFFLRALELDPGNIEALVGIAGYGCDGLRQLHDGRSSACAGRGGGAPEQGSGRDAEQCNAHLLMGVDPACDRSGSAKHRRTGAGASDRPEYVHSASADRLRAHMDGQGTRSRGSCRGGTCASSPRRDDLEWLLIAGLAKTYFGEFAEASTWLRKSIDANRNRPLAFFLLAACLAHLGRLGEARREVYAGLAVDPKFTLRRYRAGVKGDNTTFVAQRERVIEGMRAGGVSGAPLPQHRYPQPLSTSPNRSQFSPLKRASWNCWIGT